MDTDTASPPQLPFRRDNLLDVAPLYAALRRTEPVTRVLTPAGDPAWLITGYAETKALFADSRLGRSHPRPDEASRISDSGVMGGPSGNYDTERADHTRMRKLLTPAFSAKRMMVLGEHVRRIVDDLLDELVAAHDGTSADLHSHLSVPLPVYVICGLLGVPYEDRSHFKSLSERAATMVGTDPQIAMDELIAYTAKLAEVKRHEPGEDVLSDLVAAQRTDPDFDDHTLARLAAGLLFAGHETTVNRINFGALLLFGNPAARQRLLDEPGSVNAIVEEVLRLAAPGDFGLVRYAHEEISVPTGSGAVTIPEGDAVILASVAANRDESVFPDANAFEPSRSPNSHLSFGYGPHFCIGASLARIELRTVFSMLFARLPELRLAGRLEDLKLHSERLTGGVDELPVTW